MAPSVAKPVLQWWLIRAESETERPPRRSLVTVYLIEVLNVNFKAGGLAIISFRVTTRLYWKSNSCIWHTAPKTKGPCEANAGYAPREIFWWGRGIVRLWNWCEVGAVAQAFLVEKGATKPYSRISNDFESQPLWQITSMITSTGNNTTSCYRHIYILLSRFLISIRAAHASRPRGARAEYTFYRFYIAPCGVPHTTHENDAHRYNYEYYVLEYGHTHRYTTHSTDDTYCKG